MERICGIDMSQFQPFSVISTFTQTPQKDMLTNNNSVIYYKLVCKNKGDFYSQIPMPNMSQRHLLQSY